MKNERALVKGLKRREKDALREFYKNTLRPVYRYVYYRTKGNHEITEDIVHDTFLKAIKSVNNFSPGKNSLQAWLCGIARNLLYEHYREVNRQTEVVQTLNHSQSNLFSRHALPLQDDSQDLKGPVNYALSLLPDNYTRMLTMKYVELRSVRDIAHALGKSEKAIESVLSRARKAFRQHFHEACSVRKGEGYEF